MSCFVSTRIIPEGHLEGYRISLTYGYPWIYQGSSQGDVSSLLACGKWVTPVRSVVRAASQA